MQTVARYAAALIVVCGLACTSSPSSPSSTVASIEGAVRVSGILDALSKERAEREGTPRSEEE